MPKLNYFRKWNQGMLIGLKPHKCCWCWLPQANSFTFSISIKYPVLIKVVSSGQHKEVSGALDTPPLPPSLTAGRRAPPMVWHPTWLQHWAGAERIEASSPALPPTLRPFHAGDNFQRGTDRCPSQPNSISVGLVPAPAKPGWSLSHPEAHVLPLPGPLAKPVLPWHQGRFPQHLSTQWRWMVWGSWGVKAGEQSSLLGWMCHRTAAAAAFQISIFPAASIYKLEHSSSYQWKLCEERSDQYRAFSVFLVY